MQHTEKNLAAAGKLFKAIADVKPDKAELASMMAEAFINGMNARERLMARDSAPDRGQK